MTVLLSLLFFLPSSYAGGWLSSVLNPTPTCSENVVKEAIQANGAELERWRLISFCIARAHGLSSKDANRVGNKVLKGAKYLPNQDFQSFERYLVTYSRQVIANKRYESEPEVNFDETENTSPHAETIRKVTDVFSPWKREVIWLRYTLDLAEEDLSGLLGLRVFSVKKVLGRYRVALLKELQGSTY